MSCCYRRKAKDAANLEEGDCPFDGRPFFVRLYEVDGKTYCQCHLPMEDQSGQPTEKATWSKRDSRQVTDLIQDYLNNFARGGAVAPLSGVVFPPSAEMTRMFEGSRINLPVHFDGCSFSGPTTFDKCTFEHEVSFEGATFGAEISFNTTQFKGPADFSGAQFLDAATFERATFADVAKFESAVFEKVAEFSSAKFSDQANFSKVQFQGRAEFSGAKFKDKAKFEDVVFMDNGMFESVVFDSWAYFSRAQFRVAGQFDFASFNHGVLFDGVDFAGRVAFQVLTEQNRQWIAQRDGKREDRIDHGDDKNFPQIDFNGANFRDRVSFSNRHFLESTDFSNTTFHLAPEFHNCVLHQDTDFSGARFLDTKSNFAARAYRTLKLAMGDVRARNEEAKFYALEQESLRNRSDTPWSYKVMSWVYMLLSDYGRNYVRPLIILVILSALSIAGYWFWASSLGATDVAPDAIAFTIQQIVRPFYIWANDELAKNGMSIIAAQMPLSLRLAATLQSILDIALIALFLLAVRRQFQLH